MQFRILYRQFVFRLMDVEMLAGAARGDAGRLFGQFGALLVFGSVLLSFGAITVGQAIRREGSAAGVWSAERFLISVTMLAVGVFALVSWDATLPDRRDALALAPLPIRAGAMAAAKIAASASALAVVVGALNCFAGFLWPLVLAPAAAGVAGTLRFIGAFWATLLAAGAFLFCAMLGLQAAVAQLPRRWSLRVTAAVQIGVFVALLGAFFLQPSEESAYRLWLPPYWFVGLLSELSGVFADEGRAVMAPLAGQAVVGLAVALVAAAGAFVLSYARTLRKTVQEPDLPPRSGAGLRLPSFGTPPQTAIGQFVLRTVARSRVHRAIFAFYLGAGFAVAAVYLGGARAASRLPVGELFGAPNASVLAASVLLLGAAVLGARTILALPLDLKANWLFQTTMVPAAAVRLRALRRALLAVAVVPICGAFALGGLAFWPWSNVAGHVLALALAGSILTDLALCRFVKVPFTCSFLPGKSQAHLLFWFGVIPVVVAIHKVAEWELRAMGTAAGYGTMIASLASIAVAARRIAVVHAERAGEAIPYEEADPRELVGLGLSGR